jgi:hypothetical protein
MGRDVPFQSFWLNDSVVRRSCTLGCLRRNNVGAFFQVAAVKSHEPELASQHAFFANAIVCKKVGKQRHWLNSQATAESVGE